MSVATLFDALSGGCRMSSEQPPFGQRPAPIPPSYYRAPPGGVSKPPIGPPPPSARWRRWLRTIPGFRTGSLWKQAVAVIGYLIIAAFVAQFAFKPGFGVFGLLGLAGVWIAADAYGIRRRLPAFRSANPLAAAAAWTALAFAMLVSFGSAVPSEPTANTGVGTGPQATRSSETNPSAVAVALPSPQSSTASPLPLSKPSASPIQKASPVAAQSHPPSHAPTPAPVAFNYCGAPANPWHYNFCTANTGKYIYSPAASFCSYFKCIASFWKSTSGYVDECQDGTYSHSGGRSGACSYHGGELRPLWA